VCFRAGYGQSATRRAPREPPDRTNQGLRLTTRPPAPEFPPERIEMTLFRVPPSPTLFRQSTGYSAIEGLWGTLDRLTDRLRGNRGGEGGEGAGQARLTPLQPCNSGTPTGGAAKKRGQGQPDGDPQPTEP